MHLQKLIIFFALVIGYSAVLVKSYKYLGVFPTSEESHFIVGSALMKALARRGHEVYVISQFPQKQPIPNYNDVPLTTMMDDGKLYCTPIEFPAPSKMLKNMVIGIQTSDNVLKDPNVQQLMTTHKKFDVVICEVFFSESLFGLSDHFQAHLIGLGPQGTIIWNTEMVGSPSPPSYVPNIMLRYTDHMTLSQRVANLAFVSFEKTAMESYYMPRQNKLYNKYFPHAKETLENVRKNAAAVLVNSHVSLGYPRPYVPNQVEVGGIHINLQRKPLPKDIEEFIKTAEYGVIYISLGSSVNSLILQANKRREFLNAFRSLKQRILWKYGDSLRDKPDNVFISDWLPQDDILAHENVKIFVNNGDYLSLMDSVYHGKPVIGIPLCDNEFLNVDKAVKKGYTIRLSSKFKSDSLIAAVDHIMNSNKNYTQHVKVMSKRFRDRAVRPLDLAVYWVEHVSRHKGAKYLHCAGLDLNFFQYHCLDIYFTFFSFAVLLNYILIWLLRKLINIISEFD